MIINKSKYNEYEIVYNILRHFKSTLKAGKEFSF